MLDVALIMFTAIVGITWGCQTLVLLSLVAAYSAGYDATFYPVWAMILAIAFFGRVVAFVRGLLR